MQIGLLIYGSLDTISGGYLYDRKLVSHLRASGDQVTIISLPWRSYTRHIGDNFSPALLARLQNLSVDVLVQDELNHPSLFWLNRRLRRSKRYPLVSIVHHLRCSEQRPAWQNILYRGIERAYLNTLDGLVFNSQTTRQVVQSLGVRRLPAVVAYPAGDRLPVTLSAEDIRQRSLAGGPLRLVFLGNMIERKGLHVLLTALQGLPRQSWQLRVIGSLDFEPAYTHAVMDQVRALDFTDRVVFLGPQDDQALVDELYAAQVMVVPSSYEGFGIAYLEGMGFGLPAIAGIHGAAGEIITHAENGYRVNPANPAELTRMIKELIEDRQKLVNLSLSARQRYLTHPSWEDSGRLIRNFLASLAKQDY